MTVSLRLIKALALAKLRHGGRAAATAAAYYNLGEVYLRRKMAVQAIEHAEEAFSAIRASEGEEVVESHVELESRASLLLGASWMLRRKWPKAEAWMLKVSELFRTVRN